ncbi:MAG: hypothetical protein MSA90_14915 [Faecalicatena sp.]|uniref:hypothetical protein n=1 Tax=Faecalicatena sp. TaxID=2005360 RepID=UPI00258F0D66|nr:hypothetical protein [Faecalicatena sp.]MCI6466742.1 hypothetical protein [Faecalicatena sp.]MCI7181981.1 hypothetical protein [Lachnospiraceae bacterium]MDY5619132.1 hypothetical protein [Lachnospiraceae bacterium]
MKKDQCYIGTPNGVVLCIDTYTQGMTKGRIYHAYNKEPKEVSSLEEMILYMEDFFNQINFPFPGTEERTFRAVKKKEEQRERMIKVMEDEELLEKHGDIGTFIIRVQQRQHSSWQGMVTWVDENETVSFRSALELIKLIDKAIGEKDKKSE